ncbi:MAG: DUF4189 domain-containing protein [Pirellulales bacterium]
MDTIRASRIRVVVALLWLALLPPASVARAQPPNTTYYVAIAFSKSTGQYGYSSGWLSETNARRDARSRCRADDAAVVLVVGNGYAALALGDDQAAFGYGYSEDADEARRFALESCGSETKNCKVVCCVHSWAG